MAFEEFIKGEVDYAQDISDIPRGNKRKCGGEKPLNRLADSDILCLNSADDFRDYLKEYFLSAATYQVLLMFARKLTVNLAGAEDLLHDAIEVLYTKYIDNEGYRKIDGLSMKDAARLLSQYVRTVMIRMHLSIVRNLAVRDKCIDKHDDSQIQTTPEGEVEMCEVLRQVIGFIEEHCPPTRKQALLKALEGGEKNIVNYGGDVVIPDFLKNYRVVEGDGLRAVAPSTISTRLHNLRKQLRKKFGRV